MGWGVCAVGAKGLGYVLRWGEGVLRGRPPGEMRSGDVLHYLQQSFLRMKIAFSTRRKKPPIDLAAVIPQR